MSLKTNKHKTSIEFDKDNWIKLQNIAAVENTSPTAILNNLLSSYLDESLPNLYEKQIRIKVYEELEKITSKETIALVSDLVAENLGLKTESVKKLAPVKTVSSKKRKKKTQNDATNDTSTTENISTTIDTSATKEDDSNNETSATSATSTTKEDKKKANIGKFTQFKASDNKRTLSDDHVGIKENKDKETIRRYRKGDRGTKADFRERWGLSWDGKGWVAIQEEI